MKRLFPFLGILLAFAALVCFEQDYLYRAQEQNLFLHTMLFFRQCMVTAGGLLTWAGAYFTQFFYYPALGAGILCLLWAVLVFLLERTFRLSRLTVAMTIIPVACLLLTVTDIGYWIFYLKLRGHLFDATLGSIVAVSLAGLYLHIPKKYGMRTYYIIVSACISYPLFGFYGLWGTLLMGILAWRSDSNRIADSVLALLAVVAVPLVCYQFLYHETNIDDIYWTALPVFCRVGQSHSAYYVPYIIMVVSTMLMALCYQPVVGDASKRCNDGSSLWIQPAVLSVAAVCVAVFWYKDDNFHRELSMMRSLESQDWEQAIKTSDGVTGEPTRAICIMRNLSLARLGRQGDEMFRHPNGAKRPDAPFSIRMVDTMGRLVYLQYGIVNYCYRWCMEDGVEYGWSVEKLKLMTKCSLINGEFAAALKYLSLLKKTDFHHKWVRKYTDYVHHPQLIADDPEISAIMQMHRSDNFLTSDMAQLEQFMMEHFTTTQQAGPVLQEQVLIAAMQTKDMRLFWQQLALYNRWHNNGRLPRHYQEAACLFGHLQNIDVSKMPFEPQVFKDYQDFAGIVGRCQQQGMSPERIQPLVYDRFHTTYYYDFYFNRYNFIEQ